MGPVEEREFDRRMLAFYRARVAAGSETPVADTEDRFGESAQWCVNPKTFTYSNGVTE